MKYIERYWIPRNVPSLKNSKRVVTPKGKRYSKIVESPLCERYRAATAWHYKQRGFEFRRDCREREMDFPIYIKFQFIRSTARAFDYINAAQIVCDIMVDNLWLPDDSHLYLLPGFLPSSVDKKSPGVFIHLYDARIPEKPDTMPGGRLPVSP